MSELLRCGLVLFFVCCALFVGQFHERQDPLHGWLGIALSIVFLGAAFAVLPPESA